MYSVLDITLAMAKGKKKVQKTAAAIPDELELQDPITCSHDAVRLRRLEARVPALIRLSASAPTRRTTRYA